MTGNNAKMKKSNSNRLYTRVNGLKIVRPFTAKQTSVLSRLNQYHQLETNKQVLGCFEDQEIKEKSIQYIKNKTVSRKEIARRTEAQRLLDNQNKIYTSKIYKKKTQPGNCGEILQTDPNITHNV